jgi:hypothetical protein
MARESTLPPQRRLTNRWLVPAVIAGVAAATAYSMATQVLDAKAAVQVARADRYRNLSDSRYGTYALHGWWVANEQDGQNGYEYQYVLGEDSRSCQGCGSYFNIWNTSTRTRAWVCGAAKYDRTINYTWKAFNGVTTPYWEYEPYNNAYDCGWQADVSGYADTGQVHWSFYLNEQDQHGTCKSSNYGTSCPPPG